VRAGIRVFVAVDSGLIGTPVLAKRRSMSSGNMFAHRRKFVAKGVLRFVGAGGDRVRGKVSAAPGEGGQG